MFADPAELLIRRRLSLGPEAAQRILEGQIDLVDDVQDRLSLKRATVESLLAGLLSHE